MPDDTPSLEKFLRRAAEICDGFDELRAHARRLSTIAGTANQPFTLAVVGRTVQHRNGRRIRDQ